MSKQGAVLAVVLLGCGSGSDGDLDVPDDHKLHDLSSNDRDALRIRYGGKQVSMDNLPMVSESIFLPASGTADVTVDITVPKTSGSPDYSKAKGHITVACTKCKLGDDKKRLMIPTKNPDAAGFLGEGIYFGHLAIDQLDAKIVLADGKLTLASWKVVSPDVSLEVDFSMDLAPVITDSKLHGCIRFKGSDSLRARDPKMFDVLGLTGAPRGEDGFDHITLEGTADEVKRLGKTCGAPPSR